MQSQKKLLHPDECEKLAQKLKSHHKKIVTINGAFDLVHAGHVYILSEAKQQADVLIVALNSDRSIREYKAKDRPIVPLQYRMELIAALEDVDYVTWFDELDPREFLQKIKPHVHVIGAEYQNKCVEKEVVEQNGGTLYFVERIEGLSTTAIIEKIKKCAL
ncbi:MAG: adenylyltransferase/cytidyltransferase family protein [Parachlamydiales bacterium]|nr:adenylyltransferase/cytidyltransferase family protein [Parachlamydiales bacterium]